MKTSSKVLYGTLLAVLVMAAPLAAQARPGGQSGGGYAHNGMGMGQGNAACPMGGGVNQAIPAEKQQAFATLMQQHRDKMQPLREQIWAKQTTLSAFSGNSKVEPKEITALVNELSGLRAQVAAERKAFAERVKKDIGVDMPFGPGAGMGRHGGMGGMGGKGGHRGGGNGGFHNGGHW